MAGWLLVISRDTELTRILSRLLIRKGGRGQLWAVESPEQARRVLGERDNFPFSIVIDELFLRQEALAAVAEEFSWYASLIVVARPEHQGQMASLVAEGKTDFVPRGDYFIPMAAALVERTLRWEGEVEEQIRLAAQQDATRPNAGRGQTLDSDGFPAEALRTIGAILDNLELVLRERSRLPVSLARRLGRVADLAFDMKQGLRLLAGCTDRENADEVGTANRR